MLRYVNKFTEISYQLYIYVISLYAFLIWYCYHYCYSNDLFIYYLYIYYSNYLYTICNSFHFITDNKERGVGPQNPCQCSKVGKTLSSAIQNSSMNKKYASQCIRKSLLYQSLMSEPTIKDSICACNFFKMFHAVYVDNIFVLNTNSMWICKITICNEYVVFHQISNICRLL